ncbi:MAG TPA: hypothetical protein VF887_09925, partial [Gemmatimonadaceae bacterium]
MARCVGLRRLINRHGHLSCKALFSTADLRSVTLAVALLGAVAPSSAVAQVAANDKPKMPPARRTLDLAGDWRFLPNNGESSFADSTVDDSRWPVMRLPSNWFLQGSHSYPANADKGQRNPGDSGDLWPVDPEAGLDWQGAVWFRRTFDWQPATGSRSILDFDMVDYIAE